MGTSKIKKQFIEDTLNQQWWNRLSWRSSIILVLIIILVNWVYNSTLNLLNDRVSESIRDFIVGLITIGTIFLIFNIHTTITNAAEKHILKSLWRKRKNKP